MTKTAEEKIIIEIDADGSIKAKTDGFKGEVCLTVLQELLGREEFCSVKPSDDFYQEAKVVQMEKTASKRD